MKKMIKGYEGKYSIYNDGRVFSEWNNKFLTPHPNKKVHYLQVGLWKQNKGISFYIHRLVANAFIPNPLGLLEVNHIDGNRQNNIVKNLEWVSRTGNITHAISTGLRVYTNRLTEADFLDCLTEVINGCSYAELSTRVPYQVPFLSTKIRAIARKYGKEDSLNLALKTQRLNRTLKNLKQYKK